MIINIPSIMDKGGGRGRGKGRRERDDPFSDRGEIVNLNCLFVVFGTLIHVPEVKDVVFKESVHSLSISFYM